MKTVLLAFVTAVTVGAAPPAQFPSDPPKPGAPKDFLVPAPKRFTLGNGLEVALVQMGEHAEGACDPRRPHR